MAILGGWMLLLLAASARGEGELLFLNGVAVRLESPAIESEAGLLVPLCEFAPLIGVEVVASDPAGTFELRWAGGRLKADSIELGASNGAAYASLDWLVGLAGGAVHRLGDDTFVTSEPASLDDLDVSEDRLVLRFSAFVPVEILEDDGDCVRLRFRHCEAPFPYRAVVLSQGPMTRVEAQAAMASSFELRVMLREIGALRLTRFEASGAYAVTVEIGETSMIESITAVAQDRELRELSLPLAGGLTSAVTVHVEAWRSTYRVRPSASDGLAELAQLVQEGSAQIGIGAGTEIGLLVIDGTPLSVPAEASTLLVTDAFGRLSSASGTGRIVLDVDGADVPIDDVNRPIRYGETVAYPPGYRGEISAGTTGGFSVLKIRAGKVVSVYQGTFIDQDPTATLVVASGESRARVAGLSLGDKARLACYIDALPTPLENALTIESVLVRDGVREDSAIGGEPRAWSVVATDVHGGLIFLSILEGGGSAGATADEVVSLLGRYGVPLKDAYVLAAGSSNSIVVNDRGLHSLGDDGRVAIALLLAPITP
jgi:hypothetical protein